MLEVLTIAFGMIIVVMGGFIFLLKVSPEEEHSLGWHRQHGKYRVRYSDGQISQPFSYKVACDYAEMFDGKVEKI